MYIRKKWQFNDDYLFDNVAYTVECLKPTGETKYALYKYAIAYVEKYTCEFFNAIKIYSIWEVKNVYQSKRMCCQ